MKAKDEVRTPGENDIDDVIASSRAGGALKVEKPRLEQPVVVAKDPSRAADAPINQQPEMSYAEAMEANAAGTLDRPVLTEQGWVTLNRSNMKAGSAQL